MALQVIYNIAIEYKFMFAAIFYEILLAFNEH